MQKRKPSLAEPSLVRGPLASSDHGCRGPWITPKPPLLGTF